jgi:hypothetical protein
LGKGITSVYCTNVICYAVVYETSGRRDALELYKSWTMDIQFWNLKLKGSVWVSLNRISEVVYRVESLEVQRYRKKKFGTENMRICIIFTPSPHIIRVIKSS